MDAEPWWLTSQPQGAPSSLRTNSGHTNTLIVGDLCACRPPSNHHPRCFPVCRCKPCWHTGSNRPVIMAMPRMEFKQIIALELKLSAEASSGWHPNGRPMLFCSLADCIYRSFPAYPISRHYPSPPSLHTFEHIFVRSESLLLGFLFSNSSNPSLRHTTT